MRHIFLIFILTFPFFAIAQKAPQEVQELAAKFEQTMIQCPQRIWSKYDWSGYSVVLSYPSQSFSWIWDGPTRTVQSVTNEALPTEALTSDYSFFLWSGRPALSLNMESIGEDAFEFGIHEFFHDQAQKGWVNNSTGRGTNYPVSWEPRAYRRMTYDHLVEYFKTGKASELERARYWYDKWTNEYPEEVATTTDGYEGTARYIEAIGAAIANLGCQASENQLRSNTLHIITTDANYTGTFEGSYFALDSEGYAMGAVASLILRFERPDLDEWNSVVAIGKTPLEILMDGIVPAAESHPAQIATLYSATGEQINRERGLLLDQDIQNWNDASYVRVALRFSWLQSNFMPSFFAHSTALNVDLFPLSQGHRMKSKDGVSDYTAAENAVGFFLDESPCQLSSAITLVKASDIQTNGFLATIRSPKINGTIKGDFQSAGGFTYLCAVE